MLKLKFLIKQNFQHLSQNDMFLKQLLLENKPMMFFLSRPTNILKMTHFRVIRITLVRSKKQMLQRFSGLLSRLERAGIVVPKRLRDLLPRGNIEKVSNSEYLVDFLKNYLHHLLGSCIVL